MHGSTFVGERDLRGVRASSAPHGVDVLRETKAALVRRVRALDACGGDALAAARTGSAGAAEAG